MEVHVAVEVGVRGGVVEVIIGVGVWLEVRTAEPV